jgi:hypothetical protein
MGLDVYLERRRWISYDEGKTFKEDEAETLFDKGITHNLNTMAREANIYEALWRPEEINISIAKELIPILEKGLEKLLKDKDHLKTFNPENGWGSYEGLVNFVREYLTACKEFPEATIVISR